MARIFLILIGVFCWFCASSQSDLSLEGLSFHADPFYELNVVNGAGGAYPKITLKSLNTTVNINSGIDYRGKNYGYLDFNGQLKYYFDAIKVTALAIRFEYSGTVCEHTPAIEGSFSQGETIGNALCNIPRDGSVKITKVEIKQITGTTGVRALQQKIDELEQVQVTQQNSTNSKSVSPLQNRTDDTVPKSLNHENETRSQPTISTQVNALIMEGNQLYVLNRYKEAIEKYDEALRLDPGNSQAISNRQNAVNRAQDQDREASARAQAEVRQNTATEFAETSTKIASNVLSEKGGRFGIVYASDGDLGNIGIVFGNSDVIHMNLAADFSEFRSMFISMDLMGINPFRNRDFRLVPATGFYMQFAETDDNGDPVEGSTEFTAIQLGLTGLIDKNGFFLKVGGLWNTFYIDSTVKPLSNFTLMIAVGFGRD